MQIICEAEVPLKYQNYIDCYTSVLIILLIILNNNNRNKLFARGSLICAENTGFKDWQQYY